MSYLVMVILVLIILAFASFLIIFLIPKIIHYFLFKKHKNYIGNWYFNDGEFYKVLKLKNDERLEYIRIYSSGNINIESYMLSTLKNSLTNKITDSVRINELNELVDVHMKSVIENDKNQKNLAMERTINNLRYRVRPKVEPKLETKLILTKSESKIITKDKTTNPDESRLNSIE